MRLFSDHSRTEFSDGEYLTVSIDENGNAQFDEEELANWKIERMDNGPFYPSEVQAMLWETITHFERKVRTNDEDGSVYEDQVRNLHILRKLICDEEQVTQEIKMNDSNGVAPCPCFEVEEHRVTLMGGSILYIEDKYNKDNQIIVVGYSDALKLYKAIGAALGNP